VIEEERPTAVLNLLAKQGDPGQGLTTLVRVLSTMVIMLSDSREEAAEAAKALGIDLIKVTVRDYDTIRSLRDGLDLLNATEGTRQ
jgi:hypothetical protein